MKFSPRILWIITLLLLFGVACQVLSRIPAQTATPQPTNTPVPTSLPPIPVTPGEENPDEPVFITGEIPYTSPFFIDTLSEPFVLLEDQAGFIQRDQDFVFSLDGQVIGPVTVNDDDTVSFSLALPAIPQGTLVDIDNDNEEDTGVQVFAVAYWSNDWGGPFLEEREGTGWSAAYASTVTDPEQDHEVVGGTLVVWAPDEQQSFPTGFGPDGLLFTQDDTVAPIPAGYNLVNLDQEPFQFYKEARPKLILHEGDMAVNDYSEMSYSEAFEALFEKASREYPFTEDKNIDWESLYDQFAPQVAGAKTEIDFYRAIRDFTWAVPDAHVGLSFNAEVFYLENGGGFGLVFQELSEGRVIVTQVMPDSPAERAGIQVGAEILRWDGQAVSEAISQVTPAFGPYSTDHHKRLEQATFLTRVPPGSRISVRFQNPGEPEEEVNLRAEVEYESLFAAIPSFQVDPVVLPVEGRILEESGLGYIRINTFSADTNLTTQLWEHFIKGFNENEVPGLIIDVRTNGGGRGDIALDFAGFFFDEEITLSREFYYNDRLEEFEARDDPSTITPAPVFFSGPVAVLVSPYCVSACEGFTYALSQENRATIVGHFPTAGAFGEVGRGQYKLPNDLSIQFPTGRPETPEGELLIEGTGVELDIRVPVTEASALDQKDVVLEEAVEAVLDQLE